MVQNITVEEVASKLDRRLESEVGSNHIFLVNQFGLSNLVDIYVEAFPSIRNSAGRIGIMFWITRYARVNPSVVKLACYALDDRSWIVRNYACGALAYAKSQENLKPLAKLLGHTNANTRDDAKAAIEAINKGNHHLFSDREGAGNVFWDPGKI